MTSSGRLCLVKHTLWVPGLAMQPGDVVSHNYNFYVALLPTDKMCFGSEQDPASAIQTKRDQFSWVSNMPDDFVKLNGVSQA